MLDATLEQFLTELIERNSALAQIPEQLSDQELTEQVSDLFDRLEMGVPMTAAELTEPIRQLISLRDWYELLDRVTDWGAGAFPRPIHISVGHEGLEDLSAGLLWGTLLIDEYQRRCEGGANLAVQEKTFSDEI